MDRTLLPLADPLVTIRKIVIGLLILQLGTLLLLIFRISVASERVVAEAMYHAGVVFAIGLVYIGRIFGVLHSAKLPMVLYLRSFELDTRQ